MRVRFRTADGCEGWSSETVGDPPPQDIFRHGTFFQSARLMTRAYRFWKIDRDAKGKLFAYYLEVEG